METNYYEKFNEYYNEEVEEMEEVEEQWIYMNLQKIIEIYKSY